MGLFSGILGNASTMSIEQATKDFGHVLGSNENIEVAYKLIRDMIIFTNRRLILIDVQGITGSKVEVRSVPYKSVTQFSVETNGTLDLDGDLKVYVSGQATPIEKKFNKSVNIFEVQAVLAEAIVSHSK